MKNDRKTNGLSNKVLTVFFYIITGIVLPLHFLLTFIYIIIILPFCYLRLGAVARALNRAYTILLFLMIGKVVHVTGKENIDPTKNYLLVANHASYYDAPAIVTFLPMAVWLGKERFLKIPVFATLLRATNFIPIYPGDSERSKNSINSSIAKLKNYNIVIFPEGTRTPDGKIYSFKKGFVHIFRGTELDILPVTLNGFYDLMPRKHMIVNPFVRLEAIVHKPIERSTVIDTPIDEVVSMVQEIIESKYAGSRG
ncbi:MAG TPA: 1-acyl-sn-glycerol-3-phosphate acyltransferase [Spirochaetota bacterium]